MKKHSKGVLKALKKHSKAVLKVFFPVLCLVIPVCIIFFTGQRYAGLYDETYYGELYPMYERLKDTEGKKIVVIGNSATAFGVDSGLLEELLAASGNEYSVCNFGLYGAIGTRVMLDLAEEQIGDGDIVLFMPEINSQALSMYFSAEELLRGINGHPDAFAALDLTLQEKTAAFYPSFISEAKKAAAEGTPQGSGVYAKASFDEHCDLKNADRPSNSMEGGTDENNPVCLDLSLFEEDFVSYVNEFYETVRDRGAEMYYVFCPMNESSVSGDMTAFYDGTEALFEFPMLGSLQESVMEEEWFYDSNFHLNASGMTVFTACLADQVKTWLGDTSITEVILPDKPGEEAAGALIEGDQSDEACFLYEEDGEGFRITGLSEEGKGRTELILPCMHEGKQVAAFDAQVFQNDAELVKVTIQENIGRLPDEGFSGCLRLQTVKLLHSSPEAISVGYHLLDGAGNARIEVGEAAYSAFRNNYFWSYYAEKIRKAEE